MHYFVSKFSFKYYLFDLFLSHELNFYVNSNIFFVKKYPQDCASTLYFERAFPCDLGQSSKPDPRLYFLDGPHQ